MEDAQQYGWRGHASVADWLFAEAYRFDFFQAVKLLETLATLAGPGDTVAVGAGSDPEREAVRFASKVRLDFPASDLETVEPPAAGEPARMTVNFFGLAGSEGPLPMPLVEILQDRQRERDYGPRDFLDIFHHRLLAILYRGAKAHRPALTAGAPEESAPADYLRAFAGLGQPGLRNRQAVPDAALLRYAGLLCQRPRSAVGLERILADYFQLPIAVRQMQGRWRALAPEERTAIGWSGQNQALGAGAALGERMWDQAGGIEIEAGPLTLAQFMDLLPGGAAQRALRDLTRFYAGALLAFSVRLVLRAPEVPQARLGAARLGWTSWIRTAPHAASAAWVRLPAADAAM